VNEVINLIKKADHYSSVIGFSPTTKVINLIKKADHYSQPLHTQQNKYEKNGAEND